MDKATQRKSVSNIMIEDRIRKDDSILNYIINSSWFARAKTVYCFMSIRNEPATNKLIRHSFEMSKNVFIPTLAKEFSLRFAKITPKTEYEMGEYGILQPKNLVFADKLLLDKSITENEVFPDIVFVPMLAYDRQLNRLGHGKGCYDRYLKGSGALRVGLSYSDFELDEVVTDLHDIKMDIIITDKGIL